MARNMRNELNSKVRHKRHAHTTAREGHTCVVVTHTVPVMMVTPWCSFVFGQTCEYFCNFWSKVAQEMGLAYGCHRAAGPPG